MPGNGFFEITPYFPEPDFGTGLKKGNF